MKSLSNLKLKYLDQLIAEYRQLCSCKQSLLEMISQVELAEVVYNSNAIENSTMTLKQTERLLLEQETQANLSLREIYEAKNLKHVIDYLADHSGPINIELILLLHRMLLTNIDNKIAGKFRQKDEYVRVANHIAPAPEFIDELLGSAMINYSQNTGHFLGAIAAFHLEFERIHPFVDGNGRMGRVLINYQLQSVGLPPIIIRNRNKKNDYYPAFLEFIDNNKTDQMERQLYLLLVESLHKRLAYLKNQTIISLAEYAKSSQRSVRSLQNSAKAQTLPAFRQNNEWSIGV